MKCNCCGNECENIEEELDGIVCCICGDPSECCQTCFDRAKNDPSLRQQVMNTCDNCHNSYSINDGWDKCKGCGALICCPVCKREHVQKRHDPGFERLYA